MISIALSLATLAMAPLTSHAHRLSADALPSVAVPYLDLDLVHPEGMKALENRIRAAAESLCPGSPRDLAFDPMLADCRAHALASARPQVLAVRDRARELAARDSGGEVAMSGVQARR